MNFENYFCHFLQLKMYVATFCERQHVGLLGKQTLNSAKRTEFVNVKARLSRKIEILKKHKFNLKLINSMKINEKGFRLLKYGLLLESSYF